VTRQIFSSCWASAACATRRPCPAAPAADGRRLVAATVFGPHNSRHRSRPRPRPWSGPTTLSQAGRTARERPRPGPGRGERHPQCRPEVPSRAGARRPGWRQAQLEQTAARLEDRDVSALVILDGYRLVGIIIERDIVRAVADRRDLAEGTAGEYMTSAPATVELETPLAGVGQGWLVGLAHGCHSPLGRRAGHPTVDRGLQRRDERSAQQTVSSPLQLLGPGHGVAGCWSLGYRR
jgi:CBS domain-containing protein